MPGNKRVPPVSSDEVKVGGFSTDRSNGTSFDDKCQWSASTQFMESPTGIAVWKRDNGLPLTKEEDELVRQWDEAPF
jgi:hypothetical protein